MEGAILSTQNNNRFRTHLKTAANVLCARTLPKQRRCEATNTARHHTYPRTTPPKRTPISCRMEPLICNQPQQVTSSKPPASIEYNADIQSDKLAHNGVISPKGSLAREVASAWGCRVGSPDEPAPADRVQSLFNDIELYPTKTQVFEMLVCARQCAGRKSLILTFGEFCVFAAELRRCSSHVRQSPTKPDSPQWTVEKDQRDKDHNFKQVIGNETSPPPYEVFLGGSCNPTTWRSDIAIPLLKEMGITYFNPQVDDWSKELMEVEHRAKAAARALLFVLDSETRAVGASVEAAHLAAAPRNLLLVLRPYKRHQLIGNEAISDQEYVELSRARATLQEAVERRGLPAFTDIPAALRCAGAVLRGARTHPRQSLGHTILRLKRVYDNAGGRNTLLSRSKAVDALKEVTKAPLDMIHQSLPLNVDGVNFETFCAAVAELASDAESLGRNGRGAVADTDADIASGRNVSERNLVAGRDGNGLRVYNARLKAYGRKLGLIIPKNGGNKVSESDSSGIVVDTPSADSSGDSVFTPGTEQRFQRLPAMLAPKHDVYLGGAFPSKSRRPEEILRHEGYTYVIPRTNDYTRMFSTPTRRQASEHPESPHRDKKPRPSEGKSPTEEVQLRDRSSTIDPRDRLSASDFYKVTDDVTPQPFKGTYDEDLLLGSRVIVFSLSSEAPCFPAMVLAAHYMGLRPADTVLIIQPIDPHAAYPYSEAAIRDYNRGRYYLADLAKRTGVAVFDDVDTAMTCVLTTLRKER